MIKLEFTQSEYDFVVTYCEEIHSLSNKIAIENDIVKVYMTETNFDEFEDAYNFSIVRNGMDNQDTVNAIGIKLYQIYDKCIL